MIKKFYTFLHNHSIGVVRGLYAAPIIIVILDNFIKSDVFFKISILICCAISLTIQIGNDSKWYNT